MSNYLWFPIAATMAILGAALLGVFRPRRILGPSRLSPGESPTVILRIIALSLGTWAICILMLGSIHQARLKFNKQPESTGLSETETVIYGGATEFIVLVAMLTGTGVARKEGFRETGINPPRISLGLVLGFIGILIVLPLMFYIDAFTERALEHFNQFHPPHELLEVLRNHPAPWLLAADIISAVVIAPFAEEFFFRGLIQTAARNFIGSSWPAILISAAAFALVHRWWTWPQIFFLGMGLGYAYERTANLWVSITMHALFNLTSIFLFTHMS